ncbi:chaperonin 10-like protein [Mycotypha africana]|uniref:chaperonin 10-like protein n=1 Tax=Mycotypha africana TaxID=64632 RepID=UPI00230013E2|nr:chaperonin 10-like protein [Mycotypha africana]KAI8991177.1 chaperonin 10-like protein [Mycotypha africana]
MSTAPTTFHGWACHGKDEPMVWEELKLRAEDDYSVDMDISHCGICGSDVHTMDANWSQPDYPVCVGHEIAGVCTRVGSKVTHIKVGDRIGVGAQSGACHQCKPCLAGFENLCRGGPRAWVGTYNGRWPNGDKSFGGYADRWRGDARFVFKIPDTLTNEVACTFFCAGVTTYAPLKRHKVGPDSVVGVMGIGGLGHYGILWAKAMGAKVVGMSHSDRKKDVAMELGCDDFVVTSDAESLANHKGELTHILCTGTSSDFKWETYVPLFRPNGIFINVGIPEWNFPEISPMLLAMSQVTICGSAIGSPAEIEDMLKFAAEHNVRPWLQKYPMKEAPKAIADFKAGKPRFRFVLEN